MNRMSTQVFDRLFTKTAKEFRQQLKAIEQPVAKTKTATGRLGSATPYKHADPQPWLFAQVCSDMQKHVKEFARAFSVVAGAKIVTDPHITLFHHLIDPEGDFRHIQRMVNSEAPCEYTVGQLRVFEGTERNAVVLLVHSEMLVKLRERLAGTVQHLLSAHAFNPHITLAYLPPFTGGELDGKTIELTGKQCSVERLILENGKKRQRLTLLAAGEPRFTEDLTGGEGNTFFKSVDMDDEWDDSDVEEEELEIIAAGLAVQAQDTGRVLMLQRSFSEDDDAAGMWEFPGGHIEDGETALEAALREWSEEVGHDVPDGSVVGEWQAGVYHGFVLSIDSEDDIELNLDADDRHVGNPDDPDGDEVEVVAWWEPSQLFGNPALREELADAESEWLPQLMPEDDVENADDVNDTAYLIAEILTEVYGDDALDMLEAGEYLEFGYVLKSTRRWDENQFRRDQRGRFAPKNVSYSDVSNSLGQALQGARTAESANELASMLQTLTIKDLNKLKKEYQVKASGRVKAELVRKISDRLDRGRRTPLEPEPEPEPIIEPQPEPAQVGTPRGDAQDYYDRTLQEEYAWARQSAVQNAGRDLLGSARHRRNEWRTLEELELLGSEIAQEAITRSNLMQRDPPNLAVAAEENPLTAVAMQFALNTIPARPYGLKSSFAQKPDEIKQKMRELYVEAYTQLKTKAEELAMMEPDPVVAMDAFNEEARAIIGTYRNGRQGAPTDRYIREQFNNMVNVINKTSVKTWQGQLIDVAQPIGRREKKNAASTQIRQFVATAKEKLGEDWRDSEELVDAAVEVASGKTTEKAFGISRESRGSSGYRFKPSEAYVTGPTNRVGGREISTDTAAAQQFLLNQTGIRGLQYGNSMTDDERYHHTLKTAEGLVDLADVFGVSDEGIGMNGRLGLAFGARGMAGAKAHFEPVGNVINLTRKTGAGSLAHEWAHFVDYNLNDGQGPATSSDPLAMDLRRSWDSAKQRIGKAVMEAHKEQSASSRMDKWKYWTSDVEMFARYSERYVQRKLDDAGRENTYLVGLQKATHEFWPTDAELDAAMPALEAIYGKLRDKYPRTGDAGTRDDRVLKMASSIFGKASGMSKALGMSTMSGESGGFMVAQTPKQCQKCGWKFTLQDDGRMACEICDSEDGGDDGMDPDFNSPFDRLLVKTMGSTDERAQLIAEILTAIYGDDALELVDGASMVTKAAKKFEESKYKRDNAGRFAEKAGGGYEAVSQSVKQALKGKRTAESANELVGMLSSLTVKDLNALKKEYDMKASGRVKADLVKKIAERLDSGRRVPESEPNEIDSKAKVEGYATELQRIADRVPQAKGYEPRNEDEYRAVYDEAVALMDDAKQQLTPEDMSSIRNRFMAYFPDIDDAPEAPAPAPESEESDIRSGDMLTTLEAYSQEMDRRHREAIEQQVERYSLELDRLESGGQSQNQMEAIYWRDRDKRAAELRQMVSQAEQRLSEPRDRSIDHILFQHNRSEPEFQLEQPRTGRRQERFETAPSGPQGALFDTGRNDLEGQNLLFNTDPAAGEDDPSTMENKVARSKLQQAIDTASRQYELDPAELKPAIEKAWQVNREYTQQHEAMKRDVRDMLGLNAADVRRIENGHLDHDSVPRFDEGVQELMTMFPELSLVDDPNDHVWSMLREGKQEPLPKHHPKIIAEAVDIVRGNQGNQVLEMAPMTDDDFDDWLMRSLGLQEKAESVFDRLFTKNCGTGKGGFKPNNDCATESGGKKTKHTAPKKLRNRSDAGMRAEQVKDIKRAAQYAKDVLTFKLRDDDLLVTAARRHRDSGKAVMQDIGYAMEHIKDMVTLQPQDTLVQRVAEKYKAGSEAMRSNSFVQAISQSAVGSLIRLVGLPITAAVSAFRAMNKPEGKVVTKSYSAEAESDDLSELVAYVMDQVGEDATAEEIQEAAMDLVRSLLSESGNN